MLIPFTASNLAEEEGGEDDGEEGLGGLDGVREGDGDLAQAHVGEHRAQHVPHGQRRDLAQLQPQKKKLPCRRQGTTNQQTKRRGKEIAASVRGENGLTHLRSGEPGRRVEPGGPHEEDEQGAEGELEGGDGVRQRQRQRAENLQWGTGPIGLSDRSSHQGEEEERKRGS